MAVSSVLTRCRYSPNIIRSCVPISVAISVTQTGDVYPASESPVSNLGMGTVLIGDMGMPAGGRFNGGHASHQTGLDVDIFLQLPKTRWTSAQLLRPQALDLVSRDGKHVVPTLWKPEIFSLIKLAARDKDVTRILLIRRLNNNFALMRAPIATGCAKCDPVPASRAYACTITLSCR